MTVLLTLLFLTMKESCSCSISGGLDSLLTLDIDFPKYNANSELVTVLQQMVSNPVAPSIVLDCTDTDHDVVTDYLTFYTSLSFSLSPDDCTDLSRLQQVLTYYNTRKPQYFIVIATRDVSAQILDTANSQDKLNEQQGYFLDVYNWIFILEEPCDDLVTSIRNVNHVVCIDLPAQVVYSAVWTGQGKRAWSFVSKLEKVSQNNTVFFVNSREKFNGRRLRIGSQFWPGYFSAVPGSNTSYTGMYVDLTREISSALNFTYDVVIPSDGLWGHQLENGSWSGLVGYLLTDRVDFVIAPMAKTYDREQFIDTSPFFLESVPAMFIYSTHAQESHALRMLVKPFDADVWLALAAAIVGLPLCAFLTAALSPKSELTAPIGGLTANWCWYFTLYFRTFWRTFTSFLTQAVPLPVSRAPRCVWAGWLIFSVIMASLWSSSVISYLAVFRTPTPFTSFSDVLEQDNYKIGTTIGSYQYKLMTTSDPDEQELWRKIQAWAKIDSDVLTMGYEVHKRKLLDDDYIFFTDVITAQLLVKDLQCQAYTIPYKSFRNDHYAIAMPQNSAYMNRMNSVTLALTEAGLPDYLLKQNVFRDITCFFSSLSTEPKA